VKINEKSINTFTIQQTERADEFNCIMSAQCGLKIGWVKVEVIIMSVTSHTCEIDRHMRYCCESHIAVCHNTTQN